MGGRGVTRSAPGLDARRGHFGAGRGHFGALFAFASLGDFHLGLFGLFVGFLAFFARLRRLFAEFPPFGLVVFVFELPYEVAQDAALGLCGGREFVHAGEAEHREAGEHEHDCEG
jgi:hypothetical protein